MTFYTIKIGSIEELVEYVNTLQPESLKFMVASYLQNMLNSSTSKFYVAQRTLEFMDKVGIDTTRLEITIPDDRTVRSQYSGIAYGNYFLTFRSWVYIPNDRTWALPTYFYRDHLTIKTPTGTTILKYNSLKMKGLSTTPIDKPNTFQYIGFSRPLQCITIDEFLTLCNGDKVVIKQYVQDVVQVFEKNYALLQNNLNEYMIRKISPHELRNFKVIHNEDEENE